MRVAIIGAGLSGLSTAIALRKYCTESELQITIYEKPSRQDGNVDASIQHRQAELGAGISLKSSGLNALGHLDTGLRAKVIASGCPCNHYKWKTAGNMLLGKEPVDGLPISRPILIDCLMECLPKAIFEYKVVKHIKAVLNQRPIIQFEDGSAEVPVDMVVGADGVGSVVRRSIFPINEQHNPQYAGYCAVGGVLDIPLPQDLIDEPCIKFFLGSTGAFGYSGLTQSDHNKLLYFSIFDTDLPGKGVKPDNKILLKELRERHGDWTDPTIARCLSKAVIDNVYPIFIMPELVQWGRDGCILVGDSGHALPPNSGSGASLAFEDGVTLGLLLAGHMKRYNTMLAVNKAISDLYLIRHERVRKIRMWSMTWKDPERPMSLVKTLAMYAFLFVFVRIRFLMTLIEGIDNWDAREEVERHLREIND